VPDSFGLGLGIVDIHPGLRQAPASAAHARERHPERMQQFHPPVAGLHIGEHEGVHAAAADQAADVLAGIGLLGDDKHPVMPVRRRLHQRLQEVHHEQAVRLQLARWHEVGQLHRPVDPHAARTVMRPVAELVHRLEDPGAGGLADPAAPVEHVGHG
jgi:hypothetical protein